jgi:hypothetical protein
MGLETRLRALEARTAPRGMATGPYVDKPWPSPEWFCEFAQAFHEMMTERDYLQYVAPDGRPMLIDDDREDTPN